VLSRLQGLDAADPLRTQLPSSLRKSAVGHKLTLTVNKLLLATVLATLPVAALAGMYDQPYALVESGDASDLRKEARVAISKVDGQSTRNPRKSDPIAPGKHSITLHFESARGVFRPISLDVEIDLQACTRYRIVANYETKTGGDWKPKVYSEPIGECVKKFKK
jgi:hypothetical protein